MRKAITIYYPVVEVTILCRSKLIEDISDFTRFVLWGIGRGKSIQDLRETTLLENGSIEEEIDYLLEQKILQNREHPALTELGKEYCALFDCMELLEKTGIKAVIYLNDGQVSLLNERCRFFYEGEMESDSVKYEDKVSRIFFHNDNYENSLEVAKEYIQERGILNEEYMPSLYTTIKVTDKQSGMLKYLGCKIEDYIQYNQSQEEKGLEIAVPLKKYVYEVFFSALDPVRPELDTLQKVSEYDNDLLSKKAIDIVDMYSKEKQQEKLVIYLDMYSRQIIKDLPETVIRNRKNLSCPMLSQSFCELTSPKDGKTRYQEVEESTLEAAIFCIPFNQLKWMEK